MPEVQLVAALKVISYGDSFGTFSVYFQMGESAARLAVSNLARGVFNNNDVMEKYMRKITQSNAAKGSDVHNNKHGVPGMIGCLDCMHVPWENCP